MGCCNFKVNSQNRSIRAGRCTALGATFIHPGGFRVALRFTAMTLQEVEVEVRVGCCNWKVKSQDICARTMWCNPLRNTFMLAVSV